MLPIKCQADVAIVRIDPQSLRAYPEWPWPRQLYAKAVDRLTDAGAAAIAFDVDFSTAREAEGDEVPVATLNRRFWRRCGVASEPGEHQGEEEQG